MSTNFFIEVDFDKLPESTAVVVPDGFCIPEGLEKWVC